ncbi:MAG: imidazoleglycerol-phosphate dehydratase HisB [Sulfobacillus sp.]
MRESTVIRQTRETKISITLRLDTPDTASVIETNLPLFTHFLTALTFYSGLYWDIHALGDVEVDPHHLVEDVGIAMGQALDQALGDRTGILRFGQQYLPMDEALVLCVLDFSGRGQLYWQGSFPDRPINGISSEIWPEFFNGLARHARMTLHLRYLEGINAHHVYEAAFKALGRALSQAVTTVDNRMPSTKGSL